jgi:hypothetical protein
MATELIFNEITAADTSDDIVITQDEGVVTFFASGLGSGEDIVIQQKVNGNYLGIVEGGTAVVLNTDNTNQGCRGPAVVRLSKPITASATSVEKMTRNPSSL